MKNEITKDIMNMSCFFKRLKTNFSKLILVNLLFSIPLIIYGALIFVLSFFVLKKIEVFLVATIIIIASPFYAGLCKITKDLALGYKCEKLLSTFTKVCKENAPKFLVIGVISYIFFILQWYAFNIYFDLSASNPIFYFPLVLSVIMCLVYLFLFFYVPTMTVTIDLSFKKIIKNGFMLIMLGLKRNFFLVGCFIFIACLFASICMLFYYPIFMLIFIGVISIVILFALISFLVNFVAYYNIYSYIIEPFEEEQEKAKMNKMAMKISSDNNGNNIDLSDTQDEYIFYNGRMIKKSVLFAQQQNTSNDNQN